LASNGYNLNNKVVFEVGSGHELISPLGWFLHGVEKVHSVDLNRRLDLEIFGESLKIVRDYDSNKLHEEYFEGVDSSLFDSRMHLLVKHAEDPEAFMSSAKINYLAPADAANVPLSDSSVDIHFSNTVFEHIPPDILLNILEEAKRILKPQGLLLHNIDLSDHFAHTDPKIHNINFLKYSKLVWHFLAGNRFAYCNRLRASEFRELFAGAGLEILAEVIVIDPNAESALNRSFQVNKVFKSYSKEDLCTTSITLLARVKT
jgi:SAM-dependent methyltransferase